MRAQSLLGLNDGPRGVRKHYTGEISFSSGHEKHINETMHRRRAGQRGSEDGGAGGGLAVRIIINSVF